MTRRSASEPVWLRSPGKGLLVLHRATRGSPGAVRWQRELAGSMGSGFLCLLGKGQPGRVSHPRTRRHDSLQWALGTGVSPVTRLGVEAPGEGASDVLVSLYLKVFCKVSPMPSLGIGHL